MKAAIRGFTITVSFILISMILGCIIQESRFSTDLRSNVSDALVSTARVIADDRYDITNNDEFMAEFEQNLLRTIKAVPDMELNIYYLGVDAEKKVISVVVEQNMPYVFYPSKTMSIGTQQSIIVDTTQEEFVWVDIRYHNVSLSELPEDTPYIHTVGEETTLPIPTRGGYVFEYWEDVKGNVVEKIEASHAEAIDLYAVWTEVTQ